ncbi:MAG: D-glycero-beta-D-manno-heptose-7-phosphate kinase [Zetaproteobacteria bacterium]|nr:MAG: D-glycero-beta-D-manno-heptose-7-phosphate kinase [Zetaproteobacteria bacterium]
MILVVGDIIVDEFLWGSVSRISPEAPVPVVAVERVDRRLGGAANVIRNLRALEADCAMCGVIGDDEPGLWVRRSLAALGVDAGGVLTGPEGHPTAVKTRIIAHQQQVVRFDRERVGALEPARRARLIETVTARLPRADALILSDYAKGVLVPEVLTRLIDAADDLPTIIDPKPQHSEAYRNATALTPNLHEAARMAGMEARNDDDHVEAIARALHGRLGLRWLLITRSERGMTLFDGERMHHIPTAARDVYDVTGAGDTVIAAFTDALCRGHTPLEAAHIANRAAGVVVGKLGTATASRQEI